MKRFFFLQVILAILASACGTALPASPATQNATSPVASTAILLPSWTATASRPLPAPTATFPVIEGTLTIKVNIRSGPGLGYASLGQLNAGEKIWLIAKEATGKWYQIIYPPGSLKFGWVSAQFVQIAAGTEVPLQATPTATGPQGRVLQRLNVRSGPGMSFSSLGLLEPDTMVSLTGKNSTASWFQIAYSHSPDGRGWVTAQYIQADASTLPVLDDYGTPVASNTAGPTPVPVTPTPTVGPAFSDHDSLANPAVHVTFSATGTLQFTYSGQVSAPEGDPEDWVAFTPFASIDPDARLVFSLTCAGNGLLTVEIWLGNSVLPGWGTLSCGDSGKPITLPGGQTYLIHLAPAPGEGLRLVNYVLTVENLP